MATDVDRVAAVLEQRTALRRRLEARAHNAALAALADLDRSEGWYDHAAITQMTAQVVTYVESAQIQVAQLTDAYLNEVAAMMVPGRPFRASGVVDPATLRDGITHQGVYGRLADQYRYQVAQGVAQDLVVAAVTARAAVMVATDIQLASTRQAARWMDDKAWREWRRVLRPEVSQTGVCGLCVAASDRTYSRGDLMPLHQNCHCDTLPVRGADDPGRRLNADDLANVYGDAGSTAAQDLIRTKYRVEENGEIGPVLVQDGHHHRGPAAVAASS